MQKECSRNKKKRNDSCQLMALHRIGRRSLTTLGTANICNDGRECCCPMSSAPRRLEQANDAHHSRQSCKMDLRTEEPSTKSKYPEAPPSPHPRLALGSCIRHDGLCRGRRRSWIAEVRFFYSRSGFRFWGLARVMDECLRDSFMQLLASQSPRRNRTLHLVTPPSDNRSRIDGRWA